MTLRLTVIRACLSLVVLAITVSAVAQVSDGRVQLVVQSGRPLRLALEHTVRVKHVGQQVSATLLEPVFAYDRIVVPIGTKAVGHIQTIERPSKRSRLRLALTGDFTPHHRVMLQFDTLMLSDGTAIPIETTVTVGAERVVLSRVKGSEETGGSRMRHAAESEVKQSISVARRPGKLERLKQAAIGSLPYHPELLYKGTVYTATLRSPLDFGYVVPTPREPRDVAPASGSILNARLITPLNSENSQRGTRIEAIVTVPVFSSAGSLIVPEGARLVGEVTLARRAGRFHRNGQLRFLFGRVQLPDEAPEELLASLYSVAIQRGDRLAVDEEGGARMTSSKTRFAAPAMGALALVGSLHGRLDYDTDGAGPETEYGGFGSSAVGGWLGLATAGAVVSQFSRPVSLALTATGRVRATYKAVFGRGRNVIFPANTSIQVQLAPGRPKQP